MYATGIYTGFAPNPMPGVRQMVEAKRLDAAQEQARKVAAAVDRMALRAARVATALAEVAQ